MQILNTPSFLTAASIMLLVGLFLFARGWKGHRLLTAARCAKCKYEVHVTLQNQPTGEVRCPECGSDLAPRRAIIFGKRKRRRGLILTGLLLTLLPTIYLSAILAQPLFNVQINWHQFRPNSNVVSHMIWSPNETWVWQELLTRQLTPNQRDQAIENLIQLASIVPHNQQWPAFFDLAFLRFDDLGYVDDAHATRYYEAYLPSCLQLDCRPRVRAGQPVYLRLDSALQFSSVLTRLCVFALHEVKIDGKPLPVEDFQMHPSDQDQLSMWGGSGIIHCSTNAVDLPVGMHQVTLTIDAGVYLPNNTPAKKSPPGQQAQWPTPSNTCTFTLSQQIEVVPADVNVIQLLNDPSKDLLKEDFPLPVVFIRRTTGGVELGCEFARTHSQPPLQIPCSYDVIVQLDGNEYVIQKHLHYLGGFRRHQFATISKSPNPGITKINLILRPDPEFAEPYPEINEIWGQEIVMKDYPLERFDLDE